MLLNLVWTIHILICIVLIIVVLLQAGKGAAAGFSFGGGASQTVFGSSGGKNFFARLTAGLAIAFMVTSITLSVFSSRSARSYRGVMEQLPGTSQTGLPDAVPASDSGAEPVKPQPAPAAGPKEAQQ